MQFRERRPFNHNNNPKSNLKNYLYLQKERAGASTYNNNNRYNNKNNNNEDAIVDRKAERKLKRKQLKKEKKENNIRRQQEWSQQRRERRLNQNNNKNKNENNNNNNKRPREKEPKPPKKENKTQNTKKIKFEAENDFSEEEIMEEEDYYSDDNNNFEEEERNADLDEEMSFDDDEENFEDFFSDEEENENHHHIKYIQPPEESIFYDDIKNKNQKEVHTKIRKIINRITNENVSFFIEELHHFILSGVASRTFILQVLMYHVQNLCGGKMNSNHKLNNNNNEEEEVATLQQNSLLPIAALMRGISILHGNQNNNQNENKHNNSDCGREMISQLSSYFLKFLDLNNQNNNNSISENAAGNIIFLLGQYYLLHGTDNLFVISLLRFLLNLAECFQQNKNNNNNNNKLELQSLAAASCGLELLRSCGEKLIKESPQEMETIIAETSEKIKNNKNNETKTVRLKILLKLMKSIAGGQVKENKRNHTLEETPSLLMLKKIAELLSNLSNPTSKQNKKNDLKTYLRLAQVSNTLINEKFDSIVVISQNNNNSNNNTHKSIVDRHQEEVERTIQKLKEGKNKKINNNNLENSESEESEMNENNEKKLEIQKLRFEEKQISGQRFHSESKKKIFKIIYLDTIHHRDDLFAFQQLYQQGQFYQHQTQNLHYFSEICDVILQTCVQEKFYDNSHYYFNIIARFFSFAEAKSKNNLNQYKKVFQFSVWDYFKLIRLEETQISIPNYVNLSRFLTNFFYQNNNNNNNNINGFFSLSLLRGLDLENVNKSISLFLRILLLRILLEIPPNRLLLLFFGGDGQQTILDLNINTVEFKKYLLHFFENNFVDEKTAKKWIPLFYDVCAADTGFDELLIHKNKNKNINNNNNNNIIPVADSEEERYAILLKRIQVIHKALKGGLN